MNGKVGNLVEQLRSAYARLEEVVNMEKTAIVRDSLIQRFEFTVELSWKTMKAYLEEKGMKDLYLPKEIIKSAFQARIVPNDPTWLDMIDTRNKTSHIYSEAMADSVYAEIPAYLPLFKKLIEALG